MKNNFNNTTYNESFKENAVKQLLSPESRGLKATASKIGIPTSTLYGWKQKHANYSDMKKSKKQSINSWTPEYKLEAIIKTASMSEHEIGEYLRKNGLHASDLESFKEDALAGFKTVGRPKIDPEIVTLKKDKKKLEKEIKRKDRALAEYSARVILLKKSHEIWGEPEDDES